MLLGHKKKLLINNNIQLKLYILKSRLSSIFYQNGYDASGLVDVKIGLIIGLINLNVTRKVALCDWLICFLDICLRVLTFPYGWKSKRKTLN